MSRLLLITNRYPVDDDDPASPFVPHFARAVAGQGVVVDVLTPSYREASRGRETSFDEQNSNVRIHRFVSGTTVPIGSWNYLDPRSWLRLRQFLINEREAGEQLCRENKYDHILALWALPSGAQALALSRRFGIGYSVWCLGSDIYIWAKRPFFGRKIARILRGASHVFGDGEDICRRVHAWLGIKAAFLPSCRPMNWDDGGFERREIGPVENPRFLCLGRVHAAKGVMELLAAFDDVRRVLPGATLDYVGDGPLLGTLRAKIMALGLSGNVTVHGALHGREVARFLHRADRVVIPSRSDSIPLVFTEAVQAGRPVIGTEVGDLGEFIRRYRVGHVTHSLSPGDLAFTMIRSAREPIFDPEGRAQIMALFDPARAATRFCGKILANRPSLTAKSPVKGPTDSPKLEYITAGSAIGESPSGKAPGC
ncbi:MAG: glycosyltransferase [Candidatus Zixiibacteriota bacterium]